MSRARPAPLAAVLVVVGLGATLLAGCGSTGASSEGTITVTGGSPVASAPVTVPAAAVDALVDRNTKAFLRTARAFNKCDKKVTNDSYSVSPCFRQATALTASVDAFLGDLRSIALPPGEYDVLVSDLAEMSSAGAKVAVKCAEARDQVCDKALARFRADQQSILWDLDASL